MRALLVGFWFILFLLSCSSSTPPSSVTPRISDRVRILADDLVAAAVVEESKVTFPLSRASEVRNLNADDIIVSTLEEGFLRRVVSVAETASGFVVETVIASLADAIIDGDINESFDIDLVDENFSGEELLSIPQGRISAKEGVIRIRQTLRLIVSIRNSKFVRAEVSTSGSIDAKTVIEGLITAQVTRPFSKRLRTKTVFVRWVNVGPLPVRISVNVGLEAIGSVDAKGYVHLVTGASLHAAKNVGVRYTNGSWSPFDESTEPTTEFVGPEVEVRAQATVAAGVRVPIDVKLYLAPGAFIATNASLKLVGNLTGTPPAASWCTSFEPSVDAGVLFINYDHSYSVSLWEGYYPFEAGLGVEACSLWDVGTWDKALWR